MLSCFDLLTRDSADLLVDCMTWHLRKGCLWRVLEVSCETKDTRMIKPGSVVLHLSMSMIGEMLTFLC